jgi:hypothetical protein
MMVSRCDRCLDNAIAGAVTEYAKHTPAANDDKLQTLDSRLMPLAQVFRTHVHTAILAVAAMPGVLPNSPVSEPVARS